MDCKTSSGLQVKMSSRVYSSPWQATVANPAPDEHTHFRQSFEDFVGQKRGNSHDRSSAEDQAPSVTGVAHP